jgi:gamma-glutamyl:cysteine ligase YbdK (ATP-grasp superfamily)
VPDQPTDVHLSAAFAALVQAMCAAALEGRLASTGPVLGDRGRADYAQNRWSAARFGPRASMLLGERYAPATELGAELIETVRPAARALGGETLLDRIDPLGCEADLQLEWQTPEEAAADLVTRSLG